MMSEAVTTRGQRVQDPPIVKFLFNDTRAGWLWLVLRVWLGFQWFDAGKHKISDPAWVQTGESLKAFWEKAVLIPETGRPAITFEWYRSFIQSLLDSHSYTWFAPLVAYGEILIGVALIVGFLTGMVAFFGGLMNWNYMMAGSASSNPVLFIIAVGLILAWKVAGHFGLDYFVLPRLGTPWHGTAVIADTPEHAAPPS